MKIFIIIFIIGLAHSNICDSKRKGIIRNNFQNVLALKKGSIISSRIINYMEFSGGNSIPFRNNPYYVTGTGGFLTGGLGYSITIELLQSQELNTVKIRLFDRDSRVFDFVIYAINSLGQTLIFESANAQSNIIVKFPTQIVQQFKFYNRGSIISNQYITIINIVAFFKQYN